MIVRKTLLWVLCAVGLAGGSVVLAGGWVACEQGIHPERMGEKYSLADFELPAPEPIRFESVDGVPLAGWFFRGDSRATVLLVHGRRVSRTWMLPDAAYLHKAGFSTFLIDLRYHGESGGDHGTLGAKETEDVKVAVEYLLSRPDVDPNRIGVQGTSLGAVTGLLAAAESPAVRGVVAESPFSSLHAVIDYAFDHGQEGVSVPSFPFLPVSKRICQTRLGVDFDLVNPLSIIASISPRPVLLIDTTQDDLLPRRSVQELFEAAREPKMLWQVEAPHGKGYETHPEEYESRVVAFWRQTLGVLQAVEGVNGEAQLVKREG